MNSNNQEILETGIRRVLIIENPKSGSGNSRLDDFKILLLAKGIGMEIRLLEPSVTIDQLVEDAEKFDAVIAAGGDGTVCCTAHALVGRNVTVMAYPAGTANLIAQNFGLSKDPAQLLDLLLKGNTVDVDIPTLEGSDKKTGFIVAAGTGFDAEMIKNSEPLKASMGVWAYVVGALKQINPKVVRFKITIDGREINTSGMSVIVANLGMINFRLPIAEGISPSDGLLNVIVLRGESPLSLLPNMLDSFKSKLGLGDPAFHEHLELYSGKNIFVESEHPMPVQYDGELFEGTTPFKIEVIKKAVKFICSDLETST